MSQQQAGSRRRTAAGDHPGVIECVTEVIQAREVVAGRVLCFGIGAHGFHIHHRVRRVVPPHLNPEAVFQTVMHYPDLDHQYAGTGLVARKPGEGVTVLADE